MLIQSKFSTTRFFTTFPVLTVLPLYTKVNPAAAAMNYNIKKHGGIKTKNI